MKFVLLFLIASVKAAKSPTQMPTLLAYSGDFCSSVDECESKLCVNFHEVDGQMLGECCDQRVGIGCEKCCIYDPEGGHGCKWFPGSCLKCKNGFELRRGRCQKRRG